MVRPKFDDYANLSRSISHALRHEPWLYELELDDNGWTEVGPLLTALRRLNPTWGEIQVADIEEMISESSKKRHELANGRIRAIYGHSLSGKFKKDASLPPAELYHGTAPSYVEDILADGLRPMGRQYVHLSVNQAIAREVGLRKSTSPILLSVDTIASSNSGSLFYIGNEKVWLTDYIPPDAISII